MKKTIIAALCFLAAVVLANPPQAGDVWQSKQDSNVYFNIAYMETYGGTRYDYFWRNDTGLF